MSGEPHVFIVQYDYQADHKVLFVDYEYREHNARLITPGSLVQHDYEANVKVLIVDYDYQADIKIMREHLPK